MSSDFFLNCRKFCGSWDPIIQFFFQSVVDVLANRLDIQLCLAILALIDDDLVVQVDLLHRFMGYRKLLVLEIFLLHVSVLSLLQIVHLFLSLNLRSQLFFGGKKSEIFRREKVIVVVQNGEARDVIVGVGA